MNIKTILLALAGVIAINTADAQDKLYKKNGDMMEVKVKEITPRTISYSKPDNPGPTYVINKGEVAKIVYENGNEDVFGEIEKKASDNPNRKKVKYGNNIISFIPMSVCSDGPAIGISYERSLDKNNILSFYMPALMIFDVTGTTTTTGAPVSSSQSYMIMPGLKLYPTGGKGVVRYSVGPNLAGVWGKKYSEPTFVYDNNGNITGQIPAGYRDRFTLGMMVTNSLNINPSAHLHMGLELGLGFSYINELDGATQPMTGLVQFGFKVGYRF